MSSASASVAPASDAVPAAKTVVIGGEELADEIVPKPLPTSAAVAAAYGEVKAQESKVDAADARVAELAARRPEEGEDEELEAEITSAESERTELEEELDRRRAQATRVGNAELSELLSEQAQQYRQAFAAEMRLANEALYGVPGAGNPRVGKIGDAFYLRGATIRSGGVTAMSPLPILSTPRNPSPRTPHAPPAVTPSLAPYSPRSCFTPRSPAATASMPLGVTFDATGSATSSIGHAQIGHQMLKITHPPHSSHGSSVGMGGALSAREAGGSSRLSARSTLAPLGGATSSAFGGGTSGLRIGTSASQALSARSATPSPRGLPDSQLTSCFGAGPLTRESFEAAQADYLAGQAALPVPRHSQLARVPKPSLLRRSPQIATMPGIPFEWHSGPPFSARGIFAPSPRLDEPSGGHSPGQRLLRNSLKNPQGPTGNSLISMKDRGAYYSAPGTPAIALPATPVPKRSFDAPKGFNSSLPRAAAS